MRRLATTVAIGWLMAVLPIAADDEQQANRVQTGEREAAAADALNFEQHVRPILKAQCFHCHGESGEREGGLDLRLVRLMRSGGDSGAALTPHDASASLLWERIESDEMPEGPKKLSPQQKQTIRTWIDQGSKTLRDEPDDVDQARFTAEELGHWAFQPVRMPAVPAPEGYERLTPIDGFVADKLAHLGLPFSKIAGRETLIRRVSFDLLGLPPTQHDIEQFVRDTSPDAYEHMVDRYLASAQYGVRWARHWLDVAGYSETNGGTGNDSDRPHAWRYRDYVVDCFNANLPIDQFIIEQLAGDELLGGPIDKSNPKHRRLLTATAFLRMAPDGTQTKNQVEERNQAVAEAVKVISSSLLGLTVGCAQCHDHKYDPIGIDDYYQFRAIFDPVFPLQKWQTPNSRVVDFTPESTQALAAEIEARAAELDEALNQKRRALAKKIQAEKIAAVPEADRAATREAILAEGDQRTDEQKRLLDLYPMVKSVGFISGFLIEYDQPSYRKFEAEAKRIAELRATAPQFTQVMLATEQHDVIPTSHIFFRGNPDSPRDEVQPDELWVLKQADRRIVLPTNREDLTTTGRRLAYAQHLVDGQHPLTARVFANRIWQHHFGAGIVSTPNDFGMAGERPTHPELLDWLANDFMQHGWDLKRLHRLIVCSRVYRQTSTRSPQLDQLDPENQWLGRMSLRRLEAEAVRDTLLAVSEQLSKNLRGASIPVTADPEGKLVIGKPQLRDGLLTGVTQTAASVRRSLYVQSKRNLPLNALATFDQPEMLPNCGQRMHTIVATQALWFMNDVTLIGHANDLADQLLKLPNDATRIELLFRRLFAERPTETELALCLEFVSQQQDHFVAGKDQADRAHVDLQSWSALCQTLFASNRFLFVD